MISKAKENAMTTGGCVGSGYVSGMTFASEEAYNSFQNICRANIGTAGDTAIGFAVSWARLMETELEKGNELDEETIERCLESALYSINGKKGLCYNWIRNLLIIHWKYGKLLMTDKLKKTDGDDPDISEFYVTDKKVAQKLAQNVA